MIEKIKRLKTNKYVCIGIILLLFTAGNALGESFKLPVTVNAAGYERTDKPVEFNVDFTQLLNGIGQPGTLDANSINVVETDGAWSMIDSNVPFQFDKDIDYDPTSKASGKIIFIMKGTTPSSGNRYYLVYFNTGGTSTPISIPSQVSISDNVIDEGISSYKISNNQGTFYFQKQSGGFSSWNDINGNDWISWAQPPSTAKYRGIPNAIWPEGNFHPGSNCCTSSIISQGPIKISIKSVNGTSWESIWDFYPNYATMTMTKAGHSYWFLYEGTPGGGFDTTNDFMYRSNGIKTNLGTSWTGDIPNEEWAYFSDPSIGSTGRSLFVVHHEDDTLQDEYWPYFDSTFTVFGFGRIEEPLQALLTTVPQHFTIGLIDGTDFTQNSKVIYSSYKDLTITKGALQMVNIPTIFVHGTDNSLWYRTPNTGWTNLGGIILNDSDATEISSQTFAVARGTDSALWYRTMTTGWSNLGGLITSSPSAAQLNGKVYVFARGTDNGLWYRTIDGSIGWTSLGGYINSGPGTTTFNNMIYIFAAGADNSLWYRTLDGSIGWTNLGGIIKDDPDASVTNGQIYVFARGTDDALWYRAIDGTMGWTNLGGMISSSPGASPDYIFARGQDNALWYKQYIGSWSEWKSLGGILNSGPGVSP